MAKGASSGVIAGAVWLAMAAGPALADPPPAAAFGRLPAVQTAVISPAGDRVALLGGDASNRRLEIAPIDGEATVTTALGNVQVRAVDWAGDAFLLLRTAQYVNLPASMGGQAYTFERVVAVDAQGRPVSRLLNNSEMSQYSTGLPVLAVQGGARPTTFVQGLDYRPSDRGAATRLRGVQNELITSIWRVDVLTGRGGLSERGNPATAGFDVDLSGQARVRFDYVPDTGAQSILVRAKGAMSWRLLEQTRSDEEGINYLGYSDPEDAVYVSRPNAEGNATVLRVSLGDGAETVVFDEGWPSAGIIWDDARKAPVAIVGGVDRRRHHWLDQGLARAQAQLERAFPGREVSLVNWNAERTRIVAVVDDRDHPPAWYLLDTQARNVSELGGAYPELAGAALGTTRWMTYAARDGMRIPAWVTRPPGAPASGGRLPLIVLPHGGPAAYDDSSFDWWAQFLASRGYVVLQPQFRGSSGFGRAFRQAGEREWAGAIQTDLLDGVAHLAGEGVIDPARVCIVGASFGGYSALAGVALHPEAYRCAASIAGVSDLPVMLGQTIRTSGEESGAIRYWRRVMGASDRRALEQASPARRAAEIRAPVLLIHGRNDTTVPLRQSEVMRDALAEAGRPTELIVLESDDHYLSTSATRTRMLEALDAFLREHLPVEAPAGRS